MQLSHEYTDHTVHVYTRCALNMSGCDFDDWPVATHLHYANAKKNEVASTLCMQTLPDCASWRACSTRWACRQCCIKCLVIDMYAGYYRCLEFVWSLFVVMPLKLIWSMQDIAKVCMILVKYVEYCGTMLGIVKVYWMLLNYARYWWNM